MAGRLAARRGQGKLVFLDIEDRSGRIQLWRRVTVLGDEGFAALLDLDLGDSSAWTARWPAPAAASCRSRSTAHLLAKCSVRCRRSSTASRTPETRSVSATWT